MAKADYKYEINHDDRMILIADMDNKKVSLTNDIQNVVAEIAERESLKIDTYKIIYRDSEGFWDGFNQLTGKFIFLRISRKRQAVNFVNKVTLKTWLR